MKILEKCKDKDFFSITSEIIDVLSIISVIFVLFEGIATGIGLSWKICIYFSVVAMLFDLIFTYNFFIELFLNSKKFSIVSMLSSSGPLLAISGPFLFGWASINLSAAAVRGFWLTSPPTVALTIASLLRLLRLNILTKDLNSKQKIDDRNIILGTLGVFMAVFIIGFSINFRNIINGYPFIVKDKREKVLESITEALEKKEEQDFQKLGVLAIKVQNQDVFSLEPSLMPADYIVLKNEKVEVYFPTNKERIAFGLIELILCLSAIASTIFYAIFIKKAQYKQNKYVYIKKTQTVNQKTNKLDDKPMCNEEISGILGKN